MSCDYTRIKQFTCLNTLKHFFILSWSPVDRAIFVNYLVPHPILMWHRLCSIHLQRWLVFDWILLIDGCAWIDGVSYWVLVVISHEWCVANLRACPKLSGCYWDDHLSLSLYLSHRALNFLLCYSLSPKTLLKKRIAGVLSRDFGLGRQFLRRRPSASLDICIQLPMLNAEG